MGDAEVKERAEKLAAAKKRFEQLKKQKEKNNKEAEKRKEGNAEGIEEKIAEDSSQCEPALQQPFNPSSNEPIKPTVDESAFAGRAHENEDVSKSPKRDAEMRTRPPHGRQPSLSLQSRMRSSSFRKTANGQVPLSPTPNSSKIISTLPPLSPEGDAVEIYRKQAARLDELEKDNRRLSKELLDAQARWKESEEQLDELRELSNEVAEHKSRAEQAIAQGEEILKLRNDNSSLQRQIAHLQSQATKSARRISSPGQSTPLGNTSDLLVQLDSKSASIETMEMEISNLRAQLDKAVSSSSSHDEQVSALTEKLDRAERAAGAAQRELADVKKNLDRASERAVKEGSDRTSAETRIRNLEREVQESQKGREESLKRVENLEKKLAALTAMHKEADMRRLHGEKERERFEKELNDMRRRSAAVENENLRLREERERLKKRDASGIVDEGLDELEDEERRRLEHQVSSLEEEVSELRRGIWRDKRRELESTEEENGVNSPGSKFDDVDLSGTTPLRRQSLANPKGQGFANVLSSGFSAFTGGNHRNSVDLLDDNEGFDEDAFRIAQEEEARKRVERLREIKRGLKEWETWRMDIVDSRLGGGGAGEIFDV